MLHKVQLLVRGGRPEIIALHALLLFTDIAIFSDNGRAALLSEWRIGQYQIKPFAGICCKRITNHNRHRFIIGDTVQHQIHRTETRRALYQLPALE